MYLSAKSEYGMMAALDLALARGPVPVQAKSIAERQGIPLKFLEHILRELRHAGLVESARGAHGGYRLAKPADEIKLGDVIQAVGGPIAAVQRSTLRNGHRNAANGNGQRRSHETIVQNVWEELNHSLLETLNRTSLADLCRRARDLEEQGILMYHI
jgi:Rrf2 family protein